MDRQLHRQKGRLGMPASARLRQVFRSNLGATIELEPFLANVAETTFPQRYQGCGTISALVFSSFPTLVEPLARRTPDILHAVRGTDRITRYAIGQGRNSL